MSLFVQVFVTAHHHDGNKGALAKLERLNCGSRIMAKPLAGHSSSASGSYSLIGQLVFIRRLVAYNEIDYSLPGWTTSRTFARPLACEPEVRASGPKQELANELARLIAETTPKCRDQPLMSGHSRRRRRRRTFANFALPLASVRDSRRVGACGFDDDDSGSSNKEAERVAAWGDMQSRLLERAELERKRKEAIFQPTTKWPSVKYVVAICCRAHLMASQPAELPIKLVSFHTLLKSSTSS